MLLPPEGQAPPAGAGEVPPRQLAAPPVDEVMAGAQEVEEPAEHAFGKPAGQPRGAGRQGCREALAARRVRAGDRGRGVAHRALTKRRVERPARPSRPRSPATSAFTGSPARARARPWDPPRAARAP